jgi:hypothetical protein
MLDWLFVTVGAMFGFFAGYTLGVQRNPRLVDRILQRKWEREERYYLEERTNTTKEVR